MIKPSKLFYLWLTVVSINAAVLIPTVFLFNYYESIGHWSSGAWEFMLICVTATKTLLWIIGVVGGICDKKFFTEVEGEGEGR